MGPLGPMALVVCMRRLWKKENDVTLIEYTCPPCPLCREVTIFTVEVETLRQWQGGRLVQDCFPHWFPEDRETLITGYCPRCWEEALPEEEEDDEDYVDEYDDSTEDWDLLAMADDFTYDPDWYVD